MIYSSAAYEAVGTDNYTGAGIFAVGVDVGHNEPYAVDDGENDALIFSDFQQQSLLHRWFPYVSFGEHSRGCIEVEYVGLRQDMPRSPRV